MRPKINLWNWSKILVYNDHELPGLTTPKWVETQVKQQETRLQKLTVGI